MSKKFEYDVVIKITPEIQTAIRQTNSRTNRHRERAIKFLNSREGKRLMDAANHFHRHREMIKAISQINWEAVEMARKIPIAELDTMLEPIETENGSENSEEKKVKTTQIKNIICKGHKGKSRACGLILCQSDGEFLLFNGLILNPKLNAQNIVCSGCGYTTFWKRNEKFRK
jgi:hypothetical protein